MSNLNSMTISSSNWFQTHLVPNDAIMLRTVLKQASDANKHCCSKLQVVPVGIVATAFSGLNIISYPARGVSRCVSSITDWKFKEGITELWMGLSNGLRSLLATAILAACVAIAIFYPGIFQKLYPEIVKTPSPNPPENPAVTVPDQSDQKLAMAMEAQRRIASELEAKFTQSQTEQKNLQERLQEKEQNLKNLMQEINAKTNALANSEKLYQKQAEELATQKQHYQAQITHLEQQHRDAFKAI